MNIAEIAGVALLGLLGTGHCIGMCAPLALAASAKSRGRGGVVARQLVYQLGKGTSYMFLGLIFLVIARQFGAEPSWGGIRNGLSVVVGAAMIGLGVSYATGWRLGGVWAQRFGGSKVCGWAAAIWQAPTVARAGLIGWVNGFLPCGLSLIAITRLVTSDQVGTVVVGAYVFSLATMPGLLLVALTGRVLAGTTRIWLMRAAGIALIGFGVLTMVRGVPAVHHWMHLHLMWPDPATTSGHHH